MHLCIVIQGVKKGCCCYINASYNVAMMAALQEIVLTFFASPTLIAVGFVLFNLFIIQDKLYENVFQM